MKINKLQLFQILLNQSYNSMQNFPFFYYNIYKIYLNPKFLTQDLMKYFPDGLPYYYLYIYIYNI